MANPEHLKILKQGYHVWNKWREDNIAINPDLAEIDLTHSDLIGFNLGSLLRNENISVVDL